MPECTCTTTATDWPICHTPSILVYPCIATWAAVSGRTRKSSHLLIGICRSVTCSLPIKAVHTTRGDIPALWIADYIAIRRCVEGAIGILSIGARAIHQTRVRCWEQVISTGSWYIHRLTERPYDSNHFFFSRLIFLYLHRTYTQQ